jgi:hypothetical protein
VQRGVGIRSLTDVDVFIIVQMYAYDPSTTLRNYVKFLFLQTGTVVSKSTISRFFVHGFPIRGSMCKPNLIPFDKFRPANFEKALIYMHIVSCIDPKSTWREGSSGVAKSAAASLLVKSQGLSPIQILE